MARNIQYSSSYRKGSIMVVFVSLARVILLLLSLLVAIAPAWPLDSADDDEYMHASRPRRFVNSLPYSESELDAGYWNDAAQDILKNHLRLTPNTRKARNLIIFLGDGMSIVTLAASRAYKGQMNGKSGEESHLSFEDFPYTGLSKTYCVNSQVPDSACTATAYLCGVKGNLGTIGVTAAVQRDDCEAMLKETNQVSSLLKWAQDAGKHTGIVTTTRVTHASPAGAYASVANRDWENDAEVTKSGQNADECNDIAEQLIYGDTGSKFQVILGGGRQNFLPNETNDEEGKNGKRKDGKNLIKIWKEMKLFQGARPKYVWNRRQLLDVDPANEDHLLGLFEGSHMEYHLTANKETEPTLAEMTRAAIKFLSHGKNGYVLFIEGGKIDHGHHASKAHYALDETLEFAKAVEMATNLTSMEDTLIVVTSDHSHTMSYSGYAERGNDIFGLAGYSGVDNLPYTTLSYANGPGYKSPEVDGSRHDPSLDNLQDINYQHPALVPLSSETHGGEDVAVFSSGPWAHLFTGVYEQNVIPHVMAYAACIGPGLSACSR